MREFKLCLLIVLAFASITVKGNIQVQSIKPNNEWWSNTIIYQVYPRSFKDSDGDGIGDLKGIIQKLDHFVDLGIETLWIGPFFKSPMDDLGYDIQDYNTIDPIFGTMEDFENLIVEMNKRNLKLLTDIVPNHSSYKCEWFQKSIKREGKYTDYYVWRNAANHDLYMKNKSVTPLPPNNWLSIFGKTAWTWNNEREQFYFHQFAQKQPDFNIRNPKVHKELLDVLEYWMDKGVLGFRLDALRHLYENSAFPDEPYFPGKEGSTMYDDMIHVYTTDQSEVIDAIYEWRKFLDDYKTKRNLSLTPILTTESYTKPSVIREYFGNSTHHGAQIPFNFKIMYPDRQNFIGFLEERIAEWYEYLPENMVSNWVMENHDNPRIATLASPESVPIFTVLKLILPGIDVTYYGGEIGMENTFVRQDQTQDPNNAGGKNEDITRDGERCPMQWDDSPNAGFTEAKKPWLPVNPNYYKLNVEAQKNMPSSNYNIYKKMSQLRKTDTLKYGDFQTYNVSKSIYILKRSLAEHESYMAVINFGSEIETIVFSNIIKNLKEKLYVCLGSENSGYQTGSTVSTYSVSENPLQLRPLSVVVLTDKHITRESPIDVHSGSSNIKISSKFIAVLITFLLFILYA